MKVNIHVEQKIKLSNKDKISNRTIILILEPEAKGKSVRSCFILEFDLSFVVNFIFLHKC